MSDNDQITNSDLIRFQENRYENPKCETKFTFKKEEDEDEKKRISDEVRDKLIQSRLKKAKIKDSLFTYDELCKIFCSEPTKSSDCRKGQFKSWERFCDIKKVDRKYHLSNIKKNPPPDLHRSEVKQHIANILYLYMYLHPQAKREDGRITFTRRELYEILGYVNSNYFKSDDLDYIKENYPTIWEEYNSKLVNYMNAQIASAFSTLRKKRIIDELDGYEFQIDGEWKRMNTDSNSTEISNLLSCENYALNKMAEEDFARKKEEWEKQEYPNKDKWKPTLKSYDIGYIFATGRYSEFKKKVCTTYFFRYKTKLNDYRRIYDVYVLRHYLGEKLKQEFGADFIESANRIYNLERAAVNEKTTVKNLESQKRISTEKKNMSEIALKVLDKDVEFETNTLIYLTEQEKYNEVANQIEDFYKKDFKERGELVIDKYVEIFKDITTKLIKIYPDRF